MSDHRTTSSGIEIPAVAQPYSAKPEQPGEYPYTRGVHPTGYRSRLWTIRPYSGFATAAETNQRFRQLLARGSTGLSMAFDLPTQMGYDSDDPTAAGEVGKVGVAISCLDDMREVFDGISLADVSTSMTINAPAAMLLLLYEIVATEQGADPAQLQGTIQNDILKEYIARGTYIFPPRPALRLITDTFAYCAENLPRWNTISISGYHMREAGSTAVQEIAFTFANGMAYVEAAKAAGLSADDVGPRLSFFFGCHNTLFEEAAKFRAARRLWARLMKERNGATNPKAMMLRFHTQTDGATLTAQQPVNNVVRVAYQALAAVLGGTSSLHTNSMDEALGLPTTESATIALRTQQILGYETGVPDTVDPLAGSYFVEQLTDELESRAEALLQQVLDRGGSVESIDWIKEQIEDSAFAEQQRIESGEQVVVGVNRFTVDDEPEPEILKVDPSIESGRRDRLAALRARRDQAAVDAALAAVKDAATGTANVLLPIKEAFKQDATLGEVCNVLRGVWGIHRPAG